MSPSNASWRPDIARLRERLDAAPDKAVLIDQYGHAWQKSGYLSMWYRAYDSNGTSAHELMQNAGKDAKIIEVES